MISHSDRILHIQTMEQMNNLSDPRRLEILRYLMTKPSTVSQLGRQLGHYPAAIRYHIKKLVDAELAELNEVRISPGFTEKYYSAKANAFSIQKTILPITDRKLIIFMGSHDLAWEKIINKFCEVYDQVNIFNFPIGSLDGLIALRQGYCQITGSHLLDFDTQQYNLPYVKHLFPGQGTHLVRLASRVQGLLFAKGNPKGIKGLDDICRPDISFINRNPGSGTRTWLDKRLSELGFHPMFINGYTKEMVSHTAIAHHIKLGLADLGIGLIAAGDDFFLDSIPLFEEQYDLIIPSDNLENHAISEVLDFISSLAVRKTIEYFPGYDSHRTGTIIET